MKLIEEFVDDLDDETHETFRTFAQLMDEVAYAWDREYPIHRDASGVFIIHKLAVGKNWAQYKEHFYKVSPGVYEKFCSFVELLNE